MTEKPNFLTAWQQRMDKVYRLRRVATPKQVEDVLPDSLKYWESELAEMNGFVGGAVEMEDIPVKEIVIYKDQGGQHGR